MEIELIEKYALSEKSKPKSLFSHVGIIGCGSTGQSITLMIASKGIDVIFIELSQQKIDEALVEIAQELDNQIDHWGMTATDKKLIMSRIKGSLNYADLSPCDIVIESVLSKTREFSRDIRQVIFERIEKHVSRNTIIATNSTTSVITELASVLKYKDRAVSLHFSTSTKGATLVEIVKGIHANDEVCDNLRKFTKLIDKVPISVEESPGLVSVRLGVALVSEACDLLMERVATLPEIDFIMKNGLGLPTGPFELADKIGIDRLVRWMDNLYDEFGDKKYKPSPIIKRLYRANHLGKKTGRGFYEYDDHGNKIKGPDDDMSSC